jgi:dCMP deaminase
MTDSSANNEKINNLTSLIKEIDFRPNWDEYFMVTAYLISKRSTCCRLNVGCVLTKDNWLFSTGYNGHIPGTSHDSLVIDGHEQLTIHAETNSVAIAAKLGISTRGATAYVTHYPCLNCTKILISAGIKEVVYGEDYHNNDVAKNLFASAEINVRKF